MTVRIGICVVMMAACAWAQQSPQGNVSGVRRQLKGVGNATVQQQAATRPPLSSTVNHSPSTSSVPAGRSNASATGSPNAHKAGATTAVKAKFARKKKARTAAATQVEGEGQPEIKRTSTGTLTMNGRRDPFETVVRPETAGTCGAGKKCLMVNKIELKGVVRAHNGMIAVVENQQRKSYFLHENDPVFNGQVVRINPDSIVFRETVTDKVGRRSVRQVVKRITPPSV